MKIDLTEKAIHSAVYWQNRCCDLEEIIEQFCMDADATALVQEPVGPEPFGYFQYDIRLDAWVQNRINNKGAAFYTAGDIRALKHRIHDQDAMLERQTARIVELQEHTENFDGEDR
jgi:hypothetical protein